MIVDPLIQDLDGSKMTPFANYVNISDWNKVLNILKYLNNTKNIKLVYNGCRNIYTNSDASFANNLKDRKSISGHLVFLGDSPVKLGGIYQFCIMQQENITNKKNLLFELTNFKRPKFYTQLILQAKLINGKTNSELRHVNVCY
ncbi:hypothetical protein PIROE2DRAFT_2169 [Piromyces sp. E2]|nr:hypothetical protein PIROE2DRAFT_2169 [Piromyces sp. E2]|eukprot:OUM69751.1 hypothetical protein PIROE2DRAFT_2169 [Piromyces sp. E2]